MEIDIKTTCPHCEKDIKIIARSPTRESKKEPNYSFDFGMEASSKVRQEASEEKLFNEFLRDMFKNKKQSPKKLVKHFFDSMGFMIDSTLDKKELSKLKTKLNKSKLRVSKDVESEFNKTKKTLLKKVERKINKNGKNKTKQKRTKK
jgi:hypothetical protein